mgnify:CR=1 FL=1
MARPIKEPAIWKLCPGLDRPLTPDEIAGGFDRRIYEHAQLGCWSCAPGWETVALCPYPEHDPAQNPRLRVTGYCAGCRRYADMAKRPATRDLLAQLDAAEAVAPD